MPEESKRTCEHCGSTDVSLPKGLGYYFCFDCKRLLEEVTQPAPAQVLLPGM